MSPLRANFLLRGLLIGFSIAAPVGPIGILCIRRSLADGRQAGLVTGLGAATADAAYGAVAAFGLTAISRLLVAQRSWLGVLGGLFLCWLGVRTLLSTPREDASDVRGGGLWSAYASTVVLTLTNPMTILSFVAVFAGLGLGASPDVAAAGSMVAGVFLGSALWWIILSSAAAWMRRRISTGGMRGLNMLSGAIILGFGVYAVAAAFRR